MPDVRPFRALRFDPSTVGDVGLVHAVVPEAELDARVDACVRALLAAAPGAVAGAKAMIRQVAGQPPASVLELTVDALATRRASREGQEGLKAYLEKRPPSWYVSPDPDR